MRSPINFPHPLTRTISPKCYCSFLSKMLKPAFCRGLGGTLSLTILGASIHKNENTHFHFYIVDLSLRHRTRGTEMGTDRGRIASDSRGQRGGRSFQISEHRQPTGAV